MSQFSCGAVVIGRNEGKRLISCIDSLSDFKQVIYVDSGSTDGSVDVAQARRARVLALDMSLPFTAARARNEGLELLRRSLPGVEFVQFIDGDCELRSGWLEDALETMFSRPLAGVVCGRRRERFPEASVYNAQCDREWNTPIGLARSCGGDALMRMDALDEVGGYDPTMIAGEEPELCVRLRAKGWEIHRIDVEMTWHDAAIFRFGQFWKRARRAGHAYAEGAYLHGAPPERHNVAQVRRALFWGMAMPLVLMASLLAIGLWSLLLIGIYPLQVMRLAKRKGGRRDAWEEALLLTVAKFAESQGILEFYLRQLSGRRSKLIEYK
ncbi:glycosyltransferase [Thioclava kandeliae]|uniref:Glycosyltransferase family 2 protein n=1 Tax=Thioclava kandeliae TaxID=3070818 RepID=A0ABV1SMA1_9RHOB